MSDIQFERGRDDELADVKLPMKNAQRRYEKIMGTLTLFAPQEDDPVCCEVGPVQEVINQRPITPIEEEIKAAPATLTHLKKLVRRRLQPRESKAGITQEEQLEMAGMLMGEISAIWTDLQDQVEYPFFSYSQNRELNRRVAVHVVTVCSELFKQYLAKAEVLQKKRVYSDEANLVRLKTEMALEAREFLKIGTVRLLILKEMQKAIRELSASVTCFYPETMDPSETPKDPNIVEMKAYHTFKDWKTDLRGAPRKEKHRFITAREDLKSLMNEMPTLNTAKLLPLLKNMPRNLSAEAKKSSNKTDTAVQSELMEDIEDIEVDEDDEDGIFLEKKQNYSLTDYELIANLGKPIPKLERADSTPELTVGQTILNELEISIDNWFPCKEVDEKLLKYTEAPELYFENNAPIKLETLTREQLRQDLVNLKSEAQTRVEQDDDELPPLVRM